MAVWLLLAIGAQFLAALTVLVDRHIVVRAAHIGRPIVYTFYVALLSGFVIVLVPFGMIGMPTLEVFLLSLFDAAVFTFGIYFLYSALSHARASDVAPVVGGISAIVTTILAGIFIDEITPRLLPPIVLLVAGTVLISHFHFGRHALRNTLIAGISLGTMLFVAKLIFLQTTFVEGFFWPRILCVVIALALLLVPVFRRAIVHGGSQASAASKGLVFGNKVLGGASGVLTALAVNLGSVSVVNALSGLQFVFLFIFSLLFANRMPSLPGGTTHGHGGWHTALGVTCILLGMAALYGI